MIGRIYIAMVLTVGKIFSLIATHANIFRMSSYVHVALCMGLSSLKAHFVERWWPATRLVTLYSNYVCVQMYVCVVVRNLRRRS